MQIHTLIEILDNLLSTSSFNDYGPNGLQVGSSEQPVTKIGVAVSADLATIQKAIEHKVSTLIVHHGVFWKGMPYPITGILYERIRLLIQHNISLIAYHLPLDAHPTIGNNWKVALDLGWENVQPFGSYLPQLGVQGTFPSIHIEEFAQVLSSYYEAPVQAKALGGIDFISSAALISGGAYKEISTAASQHVDCFISGNFDEPAWSLSFENKINFLSFGHTITEKVGPKALTTWLNEQLPESIPSLFIDTQNPF